MKRSSISVACTALAYAAFSLPAMAAPTLARPDLFKIEKFAEFTMSPLAGFGLQISDGSSGFAPGLLVSTGPTTDRDKLLFINPAGAVSALAGGFRSNEGMLFARGAYGAGLLVGEIANGAIVRVMPDTSRSDFSLGFTQPISGFGPAQLAYGPDVDGVLPEVLYATDFAGGTVRRVNPDGTTSLFATMASGAKGLTAVSALYGGGFIASTFNRNTQPFTGGIYHISADGTSVTQITSGVTGLQLLALGDANAFHGPLFDEISSSIEGRVFVPSIGLGASYDGNVSLLNPDGSLSPFLSGIDASSIAFDTSGTLGGGMFVTDVDGERGEQSIYRISAVPEPSSSVLVVIALTCLGATGLRRRRGIRRIRPCSRSTI